MRVTELLKQQHQEADKLFDRLLSGKCDVPRVADELCKILLAHMLAEQVVLFPEMRALEGDFVGEEHGLARFELGRILSADMSDPGFMAKVTKLRKLFAHHVREEEQEILPKVDEKLPTDMNERLGEQLKELFDVLVERSSYGFSGASSPASSPPS